MINPLGIWDGSTIYHEPQPFSVHWEHCIPLLPAFASHGSAAGCNKLGDQGCQLRGTMRHSTRTHWWTLKTWSWRMSRQLCSIHAWQLFYIRLDPHVKAQGSTDVGKFQYWPIWLFVQNWPIFLILYQMLSMFNIDWLDSLIWTWYGHLTHIHITIACERCVFSVAGFNQLSFQFPPWCWLCWEDPKWFRF